MSKDMTDLRKALPRNAEPGFYVVGRYYNGPLACFNKGGTKPTSEKKAKERLAYLKPQRMKANGGTFDVGPLFAELEILEIKP